MMYILLRTFVGVSPRTFVERSPNERSQITVVLSTSVLMFHMYPVLKNIAEHSS
jgi:hypothetical protein